MTQLNGTRTVLGAGLQHSRVHASYSAAMLRSSAFIQAAALHPQFTAVRNSKELHRQWGGCMHWRLREACQRSPCVAAALNTAHAPPLPWPAAGGAAVVPADAEAARQVDAWLEWEASCLRPATYLAAAASESAPLAAAVSHLAAALSKGQYLVGASLTAADVSCVQQLGWRLEGGGGEGGAGRGLPCSCCGTNCLGLAKGPVHAPCMLPQTSI